MPAQEIDPTAVLQRSHNERLILSWIRRRAELPKADLARLTGLSPTAVGGIIRVLEQDGLVRAGAPQKGRVGQPSRPYSLAPDGAHVLGLKIGRRSSELVLLDAAMRVRDVAETVYAYPTPEAVIDFVTTGADTMLDRNGRARRAVGIGVAMPSEIWCWADEIGVPKGALDVWREVDIGAALEARIGAPAQVINDATAACAAQLALDPTLGDGPADHAEPPHDFVYFFVGWFIGGGVVLGGRVHEGRRRNAGALGSMPVSSRDGASAQLIRTASLYWLQRDLVAAGHAPDRLWQGDASDAWADIAEPLAAWRVRAAEAVAQAIAASASVIDFDAAVIDGSFPPAVRAAFTADVAAAYDRLDRQGLMPLRIREGSVGRNARAIGAGCLPLLDAFAVDAVLTTATSTAA